MKIDIQDVLFWMDAIRNSEDRDRTLESFWKGQVRSKVWLIENLKPLIDYQRGYRIAIYGGWYGVLASLLYNSGIRISHITSVDIDPLCEETAYTMNKNHEIRGAFTAVTADMCEYSVKDADIIINTSCEHITQAQYERWLANQSDDALIILQSNNFFECQEHIQCSSNLEEFVRQSDIDVIKSDTLKLPKYDRYMIIGKKHV